MALHANRWLVALGGGVLALAAGLGLAWVIFSHSRKPETPPPASQGGLVVVAGRGDDAKLDPQRPLRCFVGGQFVGELPLAECARRNGVATGSLDVGLDQAGALAATNGAGAPLTPLNALAPPQSLPVNEAAPPDANATPPSGAASAAPVNSAAQSAPASQSPSEPLAPPHGAL